MFGPGNLTDDSGKIQQHNQVAGCKTKEWALSHYN